MSFRMFNLKFSGFKNKRLLAITKTFPNNPNGPPDKKISHIWSLCGIQKKLSYIAIVQIQIICGFFAT